mgnify:CR=1 FL=1
MAESTSVYVKPELLRAAKVLAKVQCRSVSSVLNQALREFLHRSHYGLEVDARAMD